MTRLPLLAAALMATLPQASRAGRDDAQKVAAAQAAECDIDQDRPFGAALGRVPDERDPKLWAVATLSGDADAQQLGDLCIALVRGTGSHFVRVASLAGAPITPPSEVDPVTNVYVDVLKTPFRFSASEVAFGVEASGEYNSEATNLSFSTLYLFRHVGNRIIPIFHAKTRGMLVDKTDPKSGKTDQRWIIRFGTTSHDGAYDLIVQRYHGTAMRRFVWNGARYIAAATRAGCQ